MRTPHAGRFNFGSNWTSFLQTVNEERISRAEESLRRFLTIKDLRGQRFLDIGSGSGIFSLAARRLGAEVVSFDFDGEAVACTEALKLRYAPGDLGDWRIERGSILDSSYVRQLGSFDVVYAWGVLHHSGNMWKALEHTCEVVAPSGKLFLAIYNTQFWTPVWRAVKRTYNVLPSFLRTPFVMFVIAPNELRSLLLACAQLNPRRYIPPWAKSVKSRGMSRWYDAVDWVGGYPFETAKPEEIFDFCRGRGFILDKLFTCGGGLGCNQFVFQRRDDR